MNARSEEKDKGTRRGAGARELLDVSHTVEDGMMTNRELPAPIICDYLSREDSRSRYVPGIECQFGKIERSSPTQARNDTAKGAARLGFPLLRRAGEGKGIRNVPGEGLRAGVGGRCATLSTCRCCQETAAGPRVSTPPHGWRTPRPSASAQAWPKTSAGSGPRPFGPRRARPEVTDGL